MTKVSEQLKTLQEMTLNELQNELLVIRKEQFNLRMKVASGALEKTHLITEARKKIARIKTLMTQKAGNGHGK
jgi:large subunit ribosomal protein L29